MAVVPTIGFPVAAQWDRYSMDDDSCHNNYLKSAMGLLSVIGYFFQHFRRCYCVNDEGYFRERWYYLESTKAVFTTVGSLYPTHCCWNLITIDHHLGWNYLRLARVVSAGVSFFWMVWSWYYRTDNERWWSYSLRPALALSPEGKSGANPMGST